MLIPILVMAIVAIIFFAFQKKSTPSLDELYKKQIALFSPAERSFLGVLQQACADDYLILGKVRVVDVIAVKSNKNRARWQQAFNKICAKHFDFVLCDKADLSIKCVIELDDKSHQNSKRQHRDQFLDDLSSAVQLPLVRFPAKRNYVVTQVKNSLMDAMGQPSIQKPALRVATANN